MPRQISGTDNRVLRLCRLLNRHRVRYLLAGGVAANLHGSVRNMRRLLDALAELPYGIARELDARELVAKPVTVVGDDPRVDILTVAWTLSFEAAWPRRIVRRIAGVRVPYFHRTSPTSSG